MAKIKRKMTTRLYKVGPTVLFLIYYLNSLKFRKVPKSVIKFPKVKKVPKSSLKFHKVPCSSKKFHKVP